MTDRKFIMLLVASSTNNELFHHKYYINFHCLHGCTGLILFGGHSISLPDCFAYTVHIYNFVRDFIRAFFKDFPVGGIF
jgi:hypothetical protein